jgi:hypothetical protein
MYAVNINVLDLFCLDFFNMNDWLGFRRSYIHFEDDSILADAHISNLFVFIVTSGYPDVIKNNVIGVRVGKA